MAQLQDSAGANAGSLGVSEKSPLRVFRARNYSENLLLRQNCLAIKSFRHHRHQVIAERVAAQVLAFEVETALGIPHDPAPE
jgi:hypothetical protein